MRAGPAEGRSGAFADCNEAKNSTISPFIAHGGKLLLCTGSTIRPEPAGDDRILRERRQTTARKRRLDSSLGSLFYPVSIIAVWPGRGRFRFVTALDKWVGQARHPTSCSLHEGRQALRPLCAIRHCPLQGPGDPAEAGNFECK